MRRAAPNSTKRRQSRASCKAQKFLPTQSALPECLAFACFVPPLVYVVTLTHNRLQQPEWMAMFAFPADDMVDTTWKHAASMAASVASLAIKGLVDETFAHLGDQWYPISVRLSNISSDCPDLWHSRHERPWIVMTGRTCGFVTWCIGMFPSKAESTVSDSHQFCPLARGVVVEHVHVSSLNHHFCLICVL